MASLPPFRPPVDQLWRSAPKPTPVVRQLQPTLDSGGNSGDVPVMSESLSLEQINGLSPEQFVAIFGDVAEHSPWVAEKAAEERPFPDPGAVTEAFVDAVLSAGDPEKLALIRAHPDLAGRLAVAGDLADASRREQASAGLDRLSAEEFERFSALNSAYREKFRFPFILAIKGADKHDILRAFEDRIGNDPESEFANAIRQVAQIVAFRINERVAP